MGDLLQKLFYDGQVYLALYCFFLIAMLIDLAFNSKKLSSFVGLLGCIVLIILIGGRWETGTDWAPYYNMFTYQYFDVDYEALFYGVEIGYVIFNRIMAFLSDEYSLLLFMDAAIAVSAVYIFIYRSTVLPSVGLFIFYNSYVITHFIGSNRRMIAIGFVCIAFLCLERSLAFRQNWRSWAFPFIAATAFHRSSLLAFPAIFVGRQRWPTSYVFSGLMICAILGLSGFPFLALQTIAVGLSDFSGITFVEKLLFYTTVDGAQAADEFDVMGQALLGIVKRSLNIAILVFYLRFAVMNHYWSRLFNIYVFGCGIYFLMIGSPVFQVVSIYYTIVEIVLFPILLSSIRYGKASLIAILAGLQFLLLVSALSPYFDLYVPYKSVLFGS
jgi:hypothetical protein